MNDEAIAELKHTLKAMKARHAEAQMAGELMKIITSVKTPPPTMDTPAGRCIIAASQYYFGMSEILAEYITEIECVLKEVAR